MATRGALKPSAFKSLAAVVTKRFQHILKHVKELSISTAPLTQAELRTLSAYLNELTRKHLDFENNVTRVIESFPTEDLTEEDLSNYDDALNDLFIQASSLIESLIQPDPQSPDAQSHSSATRHYSQESQVRLPKLELQSFNGDISKWVNFINLFDSTVHKNSNLSATCKLQYLLSTLSSDALNLVRNLPISPSNYLVAYNLLKDRYSSPRRLLSLHLGQLLDLPSISAHSAKGLRHFLNQFQENSQALIALHTDVTTDNPLLAVTLLRKLDSDLRRSLEQHRASNSTEDTTPHSLPTVREIISFLESECTHAEDSNLHTNQSRSTQPSTSGFKTGAGFNKKPPTSKQVTLTATSQHNASKTSPCFACDSTSHNIYSCATYKNLIPHKRYELIKSHHRCVNCLGNHWLRDCTSKTSCSECGMKHHSSLHFRSEDRPSFQTSRSHSTTHHGSRQESRRAQDEHLRHEPRPAAHNSQRREPSGTADHDSSRAQTSPASTRRNKETVNLTAEHSQKDSSHSTTVVLGTTLIKLTSHSGQSVVLRALLDTGSSAHLISNRACQLLGAKRYHNDTTIMGLSNTTATTRGLVYADVSTLSGTPISQNSPFHILDKISADLPTANISHSVVNLTRGFTLADPTFHISSRVDILLGNSIVPRIFTSESHSLGLGLPTLLNTKFGFVVMGTSPCISSPQHDTSHVIVLHNTPSSDHQLHDDLQRFWIQEQPPATSLKSEEENFCDTHFDSTHTRDADGRYVIRLPFKPDAPRLGNTLQIATTRFHSVERRLATQPLLKKKYVDFMDDYESSGHMSLCKDLDLASPHYFLPHHGVLKGAGTEAKIRVVFDASCQSSNGHSLNDTLMTGRKLQVDICDILMKFRTHNFVFTCDLRQMFRQLRVHQDDQRYQMIVWRKEPSQPLQHYKLERVTYGMNCSPYLAIKTLTQLAADHGHEYPLAANALTTNTYVDDVIVGASTISKTLNLQDQLIKLLRCGGFELRKWSANHSSLLEAIPSDHLETPVFLQESSSPQFSVLGIKWSPDSDEFSYHLDLPPCATTKRQILSLTAQIYDPCGFLAPIILYCKQFLQILWTQGVSWDDPISPDLADKWQHFTSDCKSIPDLKIPRALRIDDALSVELHGFADASECGFAAVIYFRIHTQDDNILTRLVLAKTRVAPLKRVTIPRLELCAAHLLAQLTAYCLIIFQHLNFTAHYLWSDSTVALTWLRTEPYKLKTFAANRVAQALELVPSHWWRHIRTQDNPADCASRGMIPSQLASHTLWWLGPEWLTLPHDSWPTSKIFEPDPRSEEELKAEPLTVLAATTDPGWNLLQRHSSWTKLLRVTAYLLRFVNACKRRPRPSGALTVDELKAAATTIYKNVQLSAFSSELSHLRKKEPCSTGIQRLAPFLDEDGLLRVGGRLSKSALPRDGQHPVLLPKNHHVVDLIIDYHHLKHLHAGPQLTQSVLCRYVWIISARSAIRSRIFKCIRCFRLRPRNEAPRMADLPRSRVTPSRPFLNTGIDYAGPFTVKVANLKAIRHVKVYFCVFVCLVTKAVHLEVVTDLTSDAFIATLVRFVSRRGLCKDIYSDCGTNFVGADAELRKTLKAVLTSKEVQSKITHFTSPQGIRFHFNPPAAPHQGGLWEAAVKAAKHHLRRVMGNTVLTLMGFITLVTQVEAMLNSRPLTPLSSDPSDVAVLTPGHFLIGAPLTAVPELDLQDVADDRLRQWQLVSALQQRIWRRWQQEYLHTLQQRCKWSTPTNNLHVGDLVLIHMSTPPLTWPLARIAAVHPGSDGAVRVVDLITSSGNLTRPAVKVFPLPMN